MKSLIFALIFSALESSHQSQPNVVVIMADDLGFNDVSYRGSSEIPTPNIDALAYNGAVLNRFYTPPLCTPSRSSFMTGKNPFKIGMQHYVIPSDEPWGLGLNDRILPQYFKEAGYNTSLIGKWHLGFYQKQYTPTERGFDSFFGYLGPYIDYYDYTLKMFDRNFSRGYDMRRNEKTVSDFEKVYATDLFTNEAVNVIESHDQKRPLMLLINHLAPHAGNEDDPLQAPPEIIAEFDYIGDIKRRTLAAMITVLDRSVGAVVKALKDNKMLENTVIVFYSDNGGPTLGMHSTMASNYPLRGQKHSGWEGAIRTNAIFYAPFLKNPGAVRNQLMHVSDLLPTLGRLAGIKFDARSKLDGIDQWDVINRGGYAARNEVVNIDDVLGFGSLISFGYKFVNGTLSNGIYDGWLATNVNNGSTDPIDYALKVLGSTTSRSIMSIQKRNRLTIDRILDLRAAAKVQCSNNVNKIACNLLERPCLFNIYEDPCEENNLANERPGVFRAMMMRYNDKKRLIVPTRRKPFDPACDPINFDLNWNWWQNDTMSF